MMYWMERILLWTGSAALVFGLGWHRLWEQWPADRFVEVSLIGVAVFAAAWVAGWGWRRPLATKALLLWVVLLAAFAGVLPVLATMLLIAAGMVLGGLLLPRESAVLQALLGILLLAGVVGWLLPLPIHYGWGYLLLCAALVRWRWRALAQTLQTAYLQWNETVAASPRLALFVVMAMGLAGIGCWLPVMQWDDLSYHLRMPWQLLEQGFYAPLAHYQIWALSPWLSDVIHAIPMLISGKEAAGPVNAFWICVLGCGLWRLSGHLGASMAARWMSAIVGVSLPLTTALAAGMQTELLTAAALVWLFALVAGPRDGGLRFWLTLAVLVGGLAAIKLSAAVMAVIPLGWALFRHRWPPLPKIFLVIGAALVLASSSYLYAWIMTGNPVLPLFNGWFQSPLMSPVNYLDIRWKTGFGLGLPWSMSFDTSIHGEIYAGGIGFLQVVFAGAWLLALLHRNTRIVALLATAAFLLPLVPIQYVRYSYPGLMVLSAVLVTTVFRVDARRAVWMMLGVWLLHFAFQANSHWMLRTGAIKTKVMAMRDEPVLKTYVPQRLIAAQIRQAGGSTGNVLLFPEPYAGEFGVRGRTINGNSPGLNHQRREADQDPSGQAWALFLQRENIHDVIFRGADIKPVRYKGLQASGAIRRAVIGESEWWVIPEVIEQ